MNSQDPDRLSSAHMAIIGGLLVSAWCLHDLALFLTSGQPELARGFWLPSLGLIAAGVLAGGLLGMLRTKVPGWILFLGAAFALAASYKLVPAISYKHVLFLRAILAIEMAVLLSEVCVLRWSLGKARCALALGSMACIAMANLQPESQLDSWPMLVPAVLFLLAGAMRSSGPRQAASIALVLMAGVPLWNRAVERGQASRADLAVPEVPLQGPGRDLLLVILDTVRADRLAPYGYRRQTTPLLDRFVEQHAERYAWARSSSSWTLPSHASLFTGLLPSEHGATHPRGGAHEGTQAGAAALADRLREDVPTLAEILGQKGYRTAGIIANHYYLEPRYGLDRGFQTYDVRPEGHVDRYLPLAQLGLMPIRAGQQSYRDAASVTERALAWLASQGGERPRFLTVNYMDAHSPYLPPAPHDAAFGAPVVKHARELSLPTRSIQYDRCLNFIDAQLARLLSAVDLDKTVVIITSDHGEALGDHGFLMHGWALFDALTHVPLYVHPVGREIVPVREEPISGAQVFDLALYELGLLDKPERDPTRPNSEWFQVAKIPKTKLMADKDLRRDLISWSEGTLKWTVSSKGQVTLIDVEQDPKELHPLQLDAEQIASAVARAQAWWAAHPALEREPTTVDVKDLDRLGDLGYLGDDSE